LHSVAKPVGSTALLRLPNELNRKNDPSLHPLQFGDISGTQVQVSIELRPQSKFVTIFSRQAPQNGVMPPGSILQGSLKSFFMVYSAASLVHSSRVATCHPAGIVESDPKSRQVVLVILLCWFSWIVLNASFIVAH
jgi:hypothetical protein